MFMKTRPVELIKSTNMPELKQRNDVESQISPRKETSPQVSGSDTKPLLRNQTRSTPVQCFKDSQEIQPENQELTVDTTANHSGDEISPSPKNSASQIEESLVKNETRNELYMPPSSTIVLKRKRIAVRLSKF